MAQPGSAPALGAGGRRFESGRPDNEEARWRQGFGAGCPGGRRRVCSTFVFPTRLGPRLTHGVSVRIDPVSGRLKGARDPGSAARGFDGPWNLPDGRSARIGPARVARQPLVLAGESSSDALDGPRPPGNASAKPTARGSNPLRRRRSHRERWLLGCPRRDSSNVARVARPSTSGRPFASVPSGVRRSVRAIPRRAHRTIWLGKVSFTDRRPEQMALVHDRFADSVRRALDPTGASRTTESGASRSRATVGRRSRGTRVSPPEVTRGSRLRRGAS